MAKTGPKPKSNEVKELEGNPGKRKLVRTVDEDDLSSGSLRQPQRLSEDERAVWQDVIGAFPGFYFTQADKFLLIAYCRAVVRVEKSESALKNKSTVLQRANGSPCLSPHVAVINSSVNQMMALAEVLGITKKVRKGVLPANPSPVPEPQDGPDGDEAEFEEDLIAPPLRG
jgi:P27 family predicted phage terminase small subunit